MRVFGWLELGRLDKKVGISFELKTCWGLVTGNNQLGLKDREIQGTTVVVAWTYSFIQFLRRAHQAVKNRRLGVLFN